MPGATIRQTFGRGGAKDGVAVDTNFEVFGPKPGLMQMTNRDVFAVSWQGGGGYGDPLERDLNAVENDVRRNAAPTE